MKRPLVLRRETLRLLATDLARVAGGAIPQPSACRASCSCTVEHSDCASCDTSSHARCGGPGSGAC